MNGGNFMFTENKENSFKKGDNSLEEFLRQSYEKKKKLKI